MAKWGVSSRIDTMSRGVLTFAVEAPPNPETRLTEPLGFDWTQVKNHCSNVRPAQLRGALLPRTKTNFLCSYFAVSLHSKSLNLREFLRSCLNKLLPGGLSQAPSYFDWLILVRVNPYLNQSSLSANNNFQLNFSGGKIYHKGILLTSRLQLTVCQKRNSTEQKDWLRRNVPPRTLTRWKKKYAPYVS